MDWWRRLFCTGGVDPGLVPREPEPFSLPSPIPRWPQGGGFAQERMHIGELEVVKITRFQLIWSCLSSMKKSRGATFYKPIGVPDGFCCLGHYAQPDDRPLHGFVLVAREATASTDTDRPALQRPVDYILTWSSDVSEDNYTGCGYFWRPCPPNGYKALGFVVTERPHKPLLDEVRCVRADLTDKCEHHDLILNIESVHSEFPFQVWRTRPSHRGMRGKGVSVGTFFCSTCAGPEDELDNVCLKNVDFSLQAMPNLDQIHALMKHYGPTVFCHPKEIYLPSSVSWFFKNGATLHKKGETTGEPIDANGSNLPRGGQNDGEYWIDFPGDDRDAYVKHGDLESAELYAHVKPALGGTFTDIAMWVFCPFNGPGTVRVGMASFALGKVGQHIGDWEHFTLRISNFTGELWMIYFSQHSGGEWVDASRLEFVEGNKAAVYSSKNGHASFPHPGCYLQGSQELGIGIRNDAARSQLIVDSSTEYQIVAAEYLGDVVTEPPWLQYMREWGPTIVYSSKSQLEKTTSYLPFNSIRSTVKSISDKLPMELYREEGPTGPKEKNMWEGDERG